MGWLDGALRIMPSWEITGFGHTFPLEVFLPAAVFPGLIFGICFLWPEIEKRYTKDKASHNLLDRPRDRPKHTAAGAAMLGLLGMLFVASSTDVLANFFHISLNQVLWAMRFLVVLAPIVAYFLTYKICKEMQALPGGGRTKVANIVTMTPEGEYVATPAPPSPGSDAEELEPEFVPRYIDPRTRSRRPSPRSRPSPSGHRRCAPSRGEPQGEATPAPRPSPARGGGQPARGRGPRRGGRVLGRREQPLVVEHRVEHHDEHRRCDGARRRAQGTASHVRDGA